MNRIALVLTLLLSSFSAFAIPPAFRTVTSTIYRGGRPTVSDLKALAGLGVTLIVNLENVPDVVRAEADAANALGIRFVSIPLDAAVTPTDSAIDHAIADIAPRGQGKAYVHCQRGQDRTGLVVALFRVESQQWTPKKAYDEMMADGLSLKYAKPLEVYFRARTGYRGIAQY